MYRLADIQGALRTLVGFEQAYNPAEYIDETLCQSDSGLYYQGAHPLLTLNNIKATMPDDYGYTYPSWDSLTTYAVGDKVGYDGAVYVCTAANTGQTPGENDYWTAYNMLSDYLLRAINNGIAGVVQKFIEYKQLASETRSLLERRTFFDGAARLTATIDNGDKIVGMEIVPVRSMGVTTKIEKIGLQMIGATGTVKMYLFHSSQFAPVQTINLNYTNTSGGFQWFVPSTPIYLPYIGSNDSGGAWFLCYNQGELPNMMQALNVSRDWSKNPCETCNGYGLESWKEITKYIQISPFRVAAPEGFTENPELWDISKTAYTNTMNYGINCEISVGCDLTDFIIEQKQMFAGVLQKQVAVNLLRTMAMNPEVRVNRNQSNVDKNDILYELDGNTNTSHPGGLGSELKQAYKALVFDTKGIDRICLTCNNHGVKYRTI